VRAAGAEEALVGSRLDAADLEAAVEAATVDVAPSGDMHGSAEYRKDLLRVMARRALETAAHRPSPPQAPPPPSRGRAQDLAGAAGASTQAVKAVPVKTVQVTVNGTPVQAAVEPRKTLADFIREEAGLTGTHLGCEHGVCGACTIQLDGRPVRSCLLFAVQAHGHEVRTVEALAPDPDGDLHPLQQAFHEAHALQCGFCTPGFLMTLEPFLAQGHNPTPSEDEIREALSGNLCRCTGYQNIVEAVRLAARRAAGGPA
jgi:carbon-monoxide dehydrogenase small subunit